MKGADPRGVGPQPHYSVIRPEDLLGDLDRLLQAGIGKLAPQLRPAESSGIWRKIIPDISVLDFDDLNLTTAKHEWVSTIQLPIVHTKNQWLLPYRLTSFVWSNPSSNDPCN